METRFSLIVEDFKAGVFKMFLKKISISKPKFLEENVGEFFAQR